MRFEPEILIDLRWKHRMRQVDVAKKIGVQSSYVWSWENGRHVPSLPMLIKLASVFDVKPEYFFVSDDSKRIINA